LKDSFVTIDNQHHFFKDFNYKCLKNAVKAQAPLFEEITCNYEASQVKLVSLVKQRYIESLNLLENRFSLLLDKLVVFIANIDVTISNAKCAKTMNLTRPIIEEGTFYEAIGLRHISLSLMMHEVSTYPMISILASIIKPNTIISHSTPVMERMS